MCNGYIVSYTVHTSFNLQFKLPLSVLFSLRFGSKKPLDTAAVEKANKGKHYKY